MDLLMLVFVLMLKVLAWPSTASVTAANLTDGLSDADVDVCYDQYNAKTKSLFERISCLNCMSFIYPKAWDHMNRSSVQMKTLDSMTIKEICLKMKSIEVDVTLCTHRVSACCSAAMDCCNFQIQERRIAALNSNSSSQPRTYCPITWDGLLCFNASQNGTLAQGVCPSYSPNFSDKKYAQKMCLSSGEWERKIMKNVSWEFTEYRTCFDQRISKAHLLFERLRLALCCVSLAFLVLSIVTFVMLSNLRNQQRIRIHINLFVALSLEALFAILSILLQTIPAYLILVERKYETQICYNSISVVHRYLQTTVFSWIFIEGLYLHRLLTNAFNKDKSLWPYCIIGWVGALIVICVYIALRLTHPMFQSQICWANSEGVLEWVTNGPSLLCIVLNLIFFANILRILLMQLQSHPNEPSNYRRALKATFILVPLFGLQWLFTMYQVDYNPDDKWANYVFFYRTLQNISKGSHGLAVALVFCLLNNEVQAEFSNCLLRHGIRVFRRRDSRRFSNRSSTNFNSRSGKHNYFVDSERISLTQQTRLSLQSRDAKSSAYKLDELETNIGESNNRINGPVEAADTMCFVINKST